MYKICRKCHKHLEAANFTKDKKGSLGKNNICKDCRKDINIDLSLEITHLKCVECKEMLSCDRFYKCRRNSTGLQSVCKVCQKKRIINSLSKIENYLGLLLRKFINRNKDIQINIYLKDLLNIYKSQNGKCALLNKDMSHNVDEKKRTDNIWNISIFINNENNPLGPSDICLVCNLCDTIKRGYNISDRIEMQKIISKIIDFNN